MKPLYDDFNLSFPYLSTGKFSSGASSKTYGSESAQKRSRRMYLDPYAASRVDSQEQPLGATSKARALEAKDEARGNDSWLEMGHINVERRYEVKTER